MNRSFKVVFNKTKGVYTAVNEATSSMKKSGNLKAASILLVGVMSSLPMAESSANEVNDNYIYDKEISSELKNGVLDLNGGNVEFRSGEGNHRVLEAQKGANSIKNVASMVVTGDNWNKTLFMAWGEGKVIDISENIGSISIGSENKPIGQSANGQSAFATGNGKINIKANGNIEIYGAELGAHAQIINGSTAGNSASVSITSTQGSVVMTTVEGGTTLSATNYSKNGTLDDKAEVTVDAENITLIADEGNGTVIGSYSANYTENELKLEDEYAGKTTVEVVAENKLDINGNIIVANGKNVGDAKVILKGSNIVLNGNIEAEKNAYLSVGSSVEDDAKYTAKIIGNISSIDSRVDVDLGSKGLLQGCINMSDSSLMQTFAKNSDSGVFLNMGHGSVWEVTGESSVSEISGEGSIVITDKQNTVTVTRLDGQLSAGFKGLTSDDFTQKELSEMVQVSELSEESLLTITVEEGDIKGAMTVSQTNEGSTYTETENTKLSSFSSVNVTNLLQWRHEMNDLTKRMGELRISPEGIGAWARLYGSEQEYGNTGTETKNTSVQVGADYDVGAGWKVGAAFSYTDSSSSMNNGSADGDMFGLAVYGAWFNDDGQFLDLIAKYSRLSTDFTAGNMSGSYDNNAFSVSAEYGWHFKFNDLAFVEPQAELTYGQVLGDDFTTGNQVRIEQDDVDSLIGRLGVRGGFYFPENKGTIYARASVLHDFDGESSFTATKGESATYTEDMGGTWYEFGIGANFNLTDTTYTYVDLEKSTGGEVKENWRWNVGLRHVW